MEAEGFFALDKALVFQVDFFSGTHRPIELCCASRIPCVFAHGIACLLVEFVMHLLPFV